MTPDPITTAREVELEKEVERLTACLAKANAGFEEYERKWYLACDQLEKLKAERDEAIFERDFYKSNLELADNHAKEVLRPEITRLTSQLEQAERVIAPFAEMLNQKHPPEYADDRQAWGFNSKDLMWGDFNRASQWIIDRQAKTDAAIGGK